MYERFYQLRERPFALSPDPEYLYPSRVHQEALDYLRYGLESQAGFIVITGEIGSGKTTLLQTLLRNVDSGTTVGRIVNTMLEPRELIETIMIDFGLDPAGRSKPLLLRDLSHYLVDQRVAGRNVLVVIDEAQNLSLGALEELRMLSNLETEKSKLLQIVLVGQPNLRDKLAAPELEQLRQRITVSYHLPPLDAGETGHYINHRLRRAALGPPVVFPRDATELIHRRSRGVPRIINVICDAALVFGYAEERREFNAATIHEVLEELEATGVLPAPEHGQPTAASVASAVPATHAMAASPTPAVVRPAVATTPLSPVAADLAQARAAAPVSPMAAGVAQTRAAAPVSPLAAGVAQARTTTPVSALAADAAEARAAALDERERQLRQRERELAEQRRVLAEEYRLMRTRAAAAAAPGAASAGAARFEAVSHPGFWHRLKRIMLGVTTS
jgi:putative secretion ATPase (PEP-CTERM system associated)